MSKHYCFLFDTSLIMVTMKNLFSDSKNVLDFPGNLSDCKKSKRQLQCKTNLRHVTDTKIIGLSWPIEITFNDNKIHNIERLLIKVVEST